MTRFFPKPFKPSQVQRLHWLALVGWLAGCQSSLPLPWPAPAVAWLDLDTPALQSALASGHVTAEAVTRQALARIHDRDNSGPALNAIVTINPDALSIARELDRAFSLGGPMGPLHGLPVILKANIDTGDTMETTAGSLALAGYVASDDAALVKSLRDAGAVIIGKANLSEWANFRGDNSSSGWSSRGEQTRNPYVLNRNPCGSSSGSAVAVAARMTALAVGTETNGSIVCPAGTNGVVGIKPTQGSVPGDGIIPIAHTQDIAGPMATTVTGAALMLAVLQGRPDDRALFELDRDNLAGLRLGVIRDHYGAGQIQEVEALLQHWISLLEQDQAVIVDPINLAIPPGIGDNELQVLLYEFKADLNHYLQASGGPIRCLQELIVFNDSNAASVMPYYGQELFLAAQATSDLNDPAYMQALSGSGDAMRILLDKVFDDQALDALIAPTNSPAWVTDWVSGDHFGLSSSSPGAISGYPSITVPGGLVHELPVGLTILGRPGTEELLVEIAGRFEAVRGGFPAPTFIPALEAP
ncbi:MAG: amidase [Pseudohongiellaceae bacterium]